MDKIVSCKATMALSSIYKNAIRSIGGSGC